MTMLRERAPETAAPPRPLPQVRETPPVRPSPPRQARPRRVGLFQEIPDSWAHGLLIGWFVLLGVALAIEPEPVRELPPSLFYDTVFPLVFVSALAAMTVGLFARRRWGTVAAMGASGLLLVATVGCLTTGHHQFGTWWLVQMGCVLGALGMSGAAWRATGRA